MILLKKKVWVLFSEETRHDLTWLQINFKHTNFLYKQIHVLVTMAETLFISQPIDHGASQNQPRFLRILNSFCEIFEKRTPARVDKFASKWTCSSFKSLARLTSRI